jgi:vancomycin resistance protein YoaR
MEHPMSEITLETTGDDVEAEPTSRVPSSDGGRRRRRRHRGRWLAIGIPVLVVALLVGAWAFDGRSGRVSRNVELGGRPAGGMKLDELEGFVADLAEEYQSAEVSIVAPAQTYQSSAGALGLALDTDATIRAARREGRDEFVLLRPFTWLVSLFRPREVDLRFTIDRDVFDPALVALEGANRVAPVEPTIQAAAEGLVVVPGTPGEGLDVDAVADDLAAAAASGTIPIEVESETTEIPPRFSEADAQAVADEGNAVAGRPLQVTAGGQSRTVPPETVRTWARAVIAADTMSLQFDPAAAQASVTELFGDVRTPGVNASFNVVNGQPVVVPSQNGTACCEATAGNKVLQALAANAGAVEVALVPAPADLTTEEAAGLGIVAEVGQPDAFGPTTRHACCESRVTNIHRIADLVRGVVILPGATFSVNGHVGERTSAKGFVEGGFIENGVLTTAIGGGVSQFATTLFNAAFFAGLDFGEYQSHSLYISRYPRGREATISYPHPDLEIVNNTPYGVLIWPTYTGTTITVHMYSTPHVTVDAGPTSQGPQGNCTRVTTPRTRTYSDGRVERDSVFGVYRPAEGVNC